MVKSQDYMQLLEYVEALRDENARLIAERDKPKPSAYCVACQRVGMSNCGSFDECGGPVCITCHRNLDSLTVSAEREAEKYELELHRADYKAIKAAGFESPGELLSAYNHQLSKKLAVFFGKMPESNGKSNWTAILYRKLDDDFMGGIGDGFTIARSEYEDRVRYDADCVRYLIGEIDKKPFILDYDSEKHSIWRVMYGFI